LPMSSQVMKLGSIIFVRKFSNKIWATKHNNTSCILQTLPYVISFCFRNWNPSLLGETSSPDRHLDLPFISTLLLCPNQRTVTPSRSGYISWNIAFLATGRTSRTWNEHFWANLKLEVSR
jgi:hypothetical protein